jgi:acyl-ACP thioesterase
LQKNKKQTVAKNVSISFKTETTEQAVQWVVYLESRIENSTSKSVYTKYNDPKNFEPFTAYFNEPSISSDDE